MTKAASWTFASLRIIAIKQPVRIEPIDCASMQKVSVQMVADDGQKAFRMEMVAETAQLNDDGDTTLLSQRRRSCRLLGFITPFTTSTGSTTVQLGMMHLNGAALP